MTTIPPFSFLKILGWKTGAIITGNYEPSVWLTKIIIANTSFGLKYTNYLRLYSTLIAYANDLLFATTFGNGEAGKRHFNHSSHQLFTVSRPHDCVSFFNVIVSSNLTAVLYRVNYISIYIEISYTHNIKGREKLKNSAWPTAKPYKRTNESLSELFCQVTSCKAGFIFCNGITSQKKKKKWFQGITLLSLWGFYLFNCTLLFTVLN